MNPKKMTNKEHKARYTPEDKSCSHCGGSLSPHLAGANIIIWCDNCGSNNPALPPSVELNGKRVDLSKEHNWREEFEKLRQGSDYNERAGVFGGYVPYDKAVTFIASVEQSAYDRVRQEVINWANRKKDPIDVRDLLDSLKSPESVKCKNCESAYDRCIEMVERQRPETTIEDVWSGTDEENGLRQAYNQAIDGVLEALKRSKDNQRID